VKLSTAREDSGLCAFVVQRKLSCLPSWKMRYKCKKLHLQVIQRNCILNGISGLCYWHAKSHFAQLQIEFSQLKHQAFAISLTVKFPLSPLKRTSISFSLDSFCSIPAV